MRALSPALLAGLAAGLLGMAPLPATQAAPVSSSFVTMVGNGDYIAGSTARIWRTGSGSVNLSGAVNRTVAVNVSGGASGQSYQLWFAAPPGETLKPGSYVDAQRAPFRTAGHPGIDVFGDGRGCNTETGRFTVLDAPADLSRLWLVYEQHCEGGEPATFGEVRIGEPAQSPDLLAAADRISWPAEYVGRDAKVIPVNLYATGSQPVTVGDASITDGDADFSVVGSTCTSPLDPGQSCTVYVGFRPATHGHRSGVLVVDDSTPAGRQVIPLDGDAVPGRTAWTLTSQPGDRFGGGSWDLDPSTTVFSASGDDHHVFLRAVPRSSGSEWSAQFQAGPGQVLLPGTTVNAVAPYDSHDPDTASMLVGGWGSCNTIIGSFTVQAASYDEGVLQSLLLLFEQHCNGADAALTGTIAWHADPSDGAAPTGVTDLQVQPTQNGAALSWQDPADPSWAETVVRRSDGLIAPTGVTAGTGQYHGKHGTAEVTGLAGGRDYSFAVFTVDSDGDVGPSSTLTLRGSALDVSAVTRSTAGSKVMLTGRLTDVSSSSPLADRTVRLESRPSGGTWAQLDTTTTDPTGRYSLASSPTTTTDYRVTSDSSTEHLGATSRVLRVTVAARVSLRADRYSGSRAARFTLTGTVLPARPGRAVALQRHRADGWHTVLSKPLSGSSVVRFHVRPGRRGTFAYRVRRPADAPNTEGLSRVVRLRVR